MTTEAKKRKRHFNMAPMYSDRRIVERAREMSDMFASNAAIELGIGINRLKRLIAEYGLSFVRLARKPEAEKRVPLTPYQRGSVVNISGVLAKKCSKCGEAKTLDKFHRSEEKKSGRKSACKSCVSSRKATLLDGDSAGCH